MNTLRPLFALTALAAFAPVSHAADFFGATRVHELSLTIPKDEWESMTPSRGRNNGPMQMDFPEVKGQLVLDGKSYEIGVRFKGNSSYMMSSRGLKRPFKLDLNKYVKGQNHEGQTKFNLNNNFSDATQVRETLAYELFRRLGVPASRTTFARVVVNVPGLYENKVLGLYTIAEQVGGSFLKTRFNTDEGMLLKPEGARGGIPDLGENWADYARVYDPKGDPTAAEKARLIAFTKLIHHADDATFAKEIGGYLDIAAFAKFLAGNVVSANGDSILSMGHNYYIWHSRKTDRFAFIPWDLNMAFGGFPIGDAVKLSLDKPYAGENKLLARFLALPAGKAAYQKACRDAAHYLRELGPLYDQVSEIAKPVMAQDAKDVVNNGGPGGFPGGPGGFGGPPGGFRPGGGQGGFPGGPPPGGGFPGGPPPGQGGQNGFRPGGGRGPGGRGPGMMGGPELKPFLSQRAAHVLAQLDGTEKGVEPQGFFPGGGPGGPGGRGPGGPGGFGPGGDFAGMIGGGVSQLAGVGENPSVDAWGEAWKKRAAAWDKDRDEKLTRDEVIAGAGAVFGDGFGPGMFLGPQLWGAFKTDAPIPVATFTAALAKWGAEWDADKDGKLTAVEMGNGVMRTFPQPDFVGGFPGGPGGPGGL